VDLLQLLLYALLSKLRSSPWRHSEAGVREGFLVRAWLIRYVILVNG
jgi:hypothetical protein